MLASMHIDYLSVLPFQFRIHFNNNKMWLHHIFTYIESIWKRSSHRTREAHIQFYFILFLNRTYTLSTQYDWSVALQRFWQHPRIAKQYKYRRRHIICYSHNSHTHIYRFVNGKSTFACWPKNGPMISHFIGLQIMKNGFLQ